MILTIGSIDYLSIKDTIRFYKELSRSLDKDGILITSAISRHKHSDSLMKEFADFELVHKTEKELEECFSKAGLKAKTWKDGYQIHSYAIAKKK